MTRIDIRDSRTVTPLPSGKHRTDIVRDLALHSSIDPPKNGEIVLWPNSRVVKCKCTFHKRQTSTTIRTFGTIF